MLRLHLILCACFAACLSIEVRPGGGPKRLRVLLEGESLLNDASSFTLFTIFLEAVVQSQEGHLSGNGWSIFGQVIGNMCKLAAGEQSSQ